MGSAYRFARQGSIEGAIAKTREWLRSRSTGKPRSFEPGEIVARVMRRAGQRRGRHQQETFCRADGGVGSKFLRRHEADDLVMLSRRLQILANGQKIDVGR